MLKIFAFFFSLLCEEHSRYHPFYKKNLSISLKSSLKIFLEHQKKKKKTLKPFAIEVTWTLYNYTPQREEKKCHSTSLNHQQLYLAVDLRNKPKKSLQAFSFVSSYFMAHTM